VVSVNKKGVLSLNKDPRVTEGKVGHVVITAPSHPDVRAELDIPLRYDYAYKANFSGSPGSDGLNGTNGTDGSNGLPGSLDPDHPSAGGNGSDGTDGTNGTDGGPGGDAPPVLIKVGLRLVPQGSAPQGSALQRSAPQPLLEISVSAAGRERFYLIDPQGGSLTVSSSGGAGGSGGKGGSGGRGGSGGIGIPNGMSGRDGLSGHNGFDGSSGSAAQVTVIYDPAAANYLGAIRLSSQGGPRPVYREEQVEPLW
jgi:hypothetical protein